MDAETRRYTTPPVTPVSGEDHGKYQQYKKLRTTMERQLSVPQKRVTPFEDNLSRDTKKPATPTSNVQSPMAAEEEWIYPIETSQRMTEEPIESTETTSGPYNLPPDLQEYMGMIVNQNDNDLYEPPWIEPTPEITVQDTMDTTLDKKPKRVGPKITDNSQTVMAGCYDVPLRTHGLIAHLYCTKSPQI
jgi:hypothetical protein